MAHRPVGTGQSFATAGVAYTSSAFNIQSSVLRLVTTDAPAFVAIGTDPIATNADYYIPANTEATLGLTKGSIAIEDISSTNPCVIDCPEGMQMPFTVQDRVTLVDVNDNDSNWTTLISHAEVTAVDTTAGSSGYYGTRLTLGNVNTSGISTDYKSSLKGNSLVLSTKVSGISTGGQKGAVYIQQVQISGDA